MVNKKIIAIIQGRLGSLTLPNKILLKLGKKTVLSFLVDRISKSKLIDEIVIAISKNNNIGTIKMEVMRNVEPKNNFLKKVRKLCDDNNIILIFDECTSALKNVNETNINLC